MKHLLLFLGERDLLYTQLSEKVNSEAFHMKAFDSMNLKKVFDEKVSYLDLSNQQDVDDFINIASFEYEDVTLIVSDDFQWHTNNVNDYVTKVERLLYGTVFTADALLESDVKRVNVMMIVNKHQDESSISHGLYPKIFNHLNELNINVHLLYVVHYTAYNIDSYAKIEFGYTDQDENHLKGLLNEKIAKVTKFIMSVVNDEHLSVRSSIAYIKD